MVLILLGLAAGGTAAGSQADHAVVGRFAITSEAGGAIWSFRPGGLLILTGPGDISSEGTWRPAAGERDFDASIDYDITGQTLTVQGQVAPGAGVIAVYVHASDAEKPDDAAPWPVESRLLGERFGMMADPTPMPSATPAECLRPQWADGVVEWDRCGAAAGAQSPGAEPSPT